jgi:hypothetical protein
MVPLAKAFQDRGDQVAWAAAAEVAPRLQAEGFEVLAAGLGDADGMAEFLGHYPELQELAPSDRPDFMFPRYFGAVRAAPMLADLLPIAADWAPSLVVRDASEFAGPIVAEVVGAPSVTHSFGSVLPAHRVEVAAEMVAPLWEAHGLTPRPYGGSYDHLYLDIYPESLRTEDTSHIGMIQALRSVPYAAPAGDDDELPALVTSESSLPLVYVTFGTVFNRDPSVIATVVSALAGLAIRVLVTVGPNGDPGSVGDQPPNVSIARYIPHTEILPRCAAVVSHAGSGTFLAALTEGLPQLCVPQGADQFLNAAACELSGAGLVLGPGSVTVESVRESMKRLLGDPSYRSVAAGLSEEIAAMPNPDEVAEIIATRFAPG